MLGIYKNNRRSIRFWIGYWFEILDNLFSILTLGFWVIDTTGWWIYSLPLKITRTNITELEPKSNGGLLTGY